VVYNANIEYLTCYLQPKNTDGFDVGASTYVTIQHTSVTNDDDCVAFKPGSTYTYVKDITCTGSHGLSVGSLAKTNADTVSYFADWLFRC
jgi:galacturan 1,4-alpha-galacturonidase